MRLLIQIMALSLLLSTSLHAAGRGLTTKKVVITVVDVEGMPVEGAFIEASRRGPGNATGHTNANGQLVLTLTREASLAMYVSREGYYTTGGAIWTGGTYKDASGDLVPRILPNSFTVTLKKVIDPVDLIKVQYRGQLPNTGKPVGFDLERGDWVKPHGQGAVNDVLFHLKAPGSGQSIAYNSLVVLFPNSTDGIQSFMAARPFSMEFGSHQAPPNKAPPDGYQQVLSLTYQLPGSSGQRGTSKNYILRTRTRTDAAGVIRQACFGWIQGEIEFDPRNPQATELVFTSFFNPDPDPDARSLEYRRYVPKNR